MIRIRNPVIRFLICSMLCIVLICYNVLTPLTTPARAIFGLDDAAMAYVAACVVQSLLVSLGVAIVQDTEGTIDFINEVTEELGTGAKDAFDRVVNAVAESWDGNTDWAYDVAVMYGDWARLAAAASHWLEDRLEGTPEGGYVIHIEGPSSTVVFDTSKAVNFDTSKPYLSEESLRSACGEGLLYFGRGPYVSPKIHSSRGPIMQVATVNCSQFGGNGNHVESIVLDEQGNGTMPIYCDYCKYGISNIPTYYFAVLHSSGSGNYYLNAYTLSFVSLIKPGSAGNAFAAGRASSCTNLKIGDDSLNVPLVVPSPGAIAVPVERDERYLPGIVTGKWDGIIGQLGSVGQSLPFNIPMTSAGLKDLTAANVLPKVLQNETATDIPAEGEVDLPKVEDLKLPANITTKFPFCIPFDLYRGLSVFVATPVKPEFRIPFDISSPMTGDSLVSTEIVLNFDRFDRLIRIMRWLQTIGFTILLAANTRKFIKW